MNSITQHVHLVDREVMDSYWRETPVVDSPFVSVNTAAEFVVTFDEQPLRQLIGRLDADGTVAVSDRTQDRETTEISTRTLWTTNDARAFAMEVLLRSPAIPFAAEPVDWRNPYFLTGQDDPVPGVMIEAGTVRWNDGRSWIRSDAARPEQLRRLAAFLPFSPQQVLASFADPPGVIGLVPYSRFLRITVAQGRAITAELRRRRGART